jgi:hypothetical protein
MKTVVPELHRPITETRKIRSKVGANVEWLAMTPIQAPDVTDQHIRWFDCVRAIWCGAMVAYIGAAIPPFPDSES